MNQRAIIVAVVLFILIVVGMFAYARLKSTELAKTQTPPPPPQAEEPMGVTHIDAKHYFINGTHTVAGEIMMPTPCDLLESEAIVRESSPEQVVIDFTVLNNTNGACAQVITNQRFKVSFDASKEAKITATFKGKPVTLNLIDAAPGESPDEFELFIKG